MKLFLIVLLEIGLLSCKQGEGFSSVSLAVYLISVTGFKNVAYWGQTIIFFDEGRGGEMFTCKHFLLYAAPAANNFFVSVFLQTLFLLTYNLFQCLQPLQTIYFKIFQPPVQKLIVRSSRKTCYFKSAILLYSVRPKQHEFCSIHSIP